MPRAHPVAIAALLIPTAVPFLLFRPLLGFFRQTQTPDVVGGIFLGFLVLGFGVLPATVALNGFLRSRLGHTIVTVSSEGLGIRERGAWKTRTLASFNASDILDVDYSTKDSIVASARRAADERLLAAGRSLSGPPVISPHSERVLASLGRFANGRGVTIKTRQGLTDFGHGLPDDEIRYLHSAVRRALGAVQS